METEAEIAEHLARQARALGIPPIDPTAVQWRQMPSAASTVTAEMERHPRPLLTVLRDMRVRGELAQYPHLTALLQAVEESEGPRPERR